ncbi:MAG: peptide deformylase [Actinomycetota bacterium]|nr:peptide deformylase [Actinomycetota bacterium]
MAPFAIRTYGDPVLRQRALEVEEIDGRLAQLAEQMIETMYEAPGVGLAAPQVGVRKRVFVFDTGDGEGARVLVNPSITESDGEWTFEEGCLSVPGLSWPIVRPRDVHLTGWDLDGNEVSIDVTEYEARVFQHEVDHLDGVLLVERLDPDQRKDAMRILRARALDLRSADPDGLGLLLGDSGAHRPDGAAVSGQASGEPSERRVEGAPRL